jgi:phosphatidylserine/phosphatidylglycerophosphate/cardiolipin synthase-like enzyme
MTNPVEVLASVCFSPDGNCLEDMLTALEHAEGEVRIQVMNFTLQRLADALIQAHGRGIDVEIILAQSHQESADDPDVCQDDEWSELIAYRLASAGIPVWIDAEVRTAHNKVMIIDRRLVIGGSYNYTYSAESRNAENVTFTWSLEFADAYLANWQERRSFSAPYRAPQCAS